MKYKINLLIVMIIMALISSYSHANIITTTFKINITIKLICNIDGVIVPVIDKQDCINKQQTHGSPEIIIQGNTKIVTY